jgi:hypothetical protein
LEREGQLVNVRVGEGRKTRRRILGERMNLKKKKRKDGWTGWVR